MADLKVPGLMGPAVVTGRPELIRLAAAGKLATPEEQQELITFCEQTVKAIQNEREVYTIIEQTIADMERQVSGIASALRRLADALQLARRSADPEAVRDALRNPNRRDT